MTEEHLFKLIDDPVEGGKAFNALGNSGLKNINIFVNSGVVNDKAGENFSRLDEAGTLRTVYFETTKKMEFKTTKRKFGREYWHEYSWQRKFTHEFLHAAYNDRSEENTINRTNMLKHTWGGAYDRDPKSWRDG